MDSSILDRLRDAIVFEYNKMVDEMEPESEQEDIDPSEAEMHDWNNHPALTAEQRGGVK